MVSRVLIGVGIVNFGKIILVLGASLDSKNLMAIVDGEFDLMNSSVGG